MAVPSDQTTDRIPSPKDLKLYTLQQKFASEAAKRLRPEAGSQFVPLRNASERFKSLEQDPWADHAYLNSKPSAVQDGEQYKYVILGGGFGGLLQAAKLIDLGLVNPLAKRGEPEDELRIIDDAGGWGGTWYWNRYPGLHCDVESYCYLPLLEELDYPSGWKYAPGAEIREHADRIAGKYCLGDKALWRSRVTAARWDVEKSVWSLTVNEGRGPDEPARNLTVLAEYFFVANGVLAVPQVPKIPGLELFAGDMFHTARWDYNVTGGSQDKPKLTGLEGKRVGIIGTGATAVQAIPRIAEAARELLVFQRTPSNVWPRGQRKVTPEEFKTKIATHPGWQLARNQNLNSHLTNNVRPGIPNLVDDEWTKAPAYSAAVGCPNWGFIDPTPEAIGKHVGALLKLDLPRGEKARARVEEIVKDKETAEKLKGWYPVWCKRPTFSDEYLQTYNRENVHLVDTNGKGVERATEKGLVVDAVEYPLDILILSTGFLGPAEGGGDPTIRSGVQFFGRGGRDISEKWETNGASALHGFMTNGFPNLFFHTAIQGSSAVNAVYSIDIWSTHIAAIVEKADERSRLSGKRFVVEPSVQAEEEWAGTIMRHGPASAAHMGCTPGYMNLEGALANMPTDPVELMKKARLGTFSHGLEAFAELLSRFREGGYKGLEFTEAASARE